MLSAKLTLARLESLLLTACDDLRGNIGVIFQDFMRYHLSAADNIAVGRIEARDDRDRIERAAREVLSLPIFPELTETEQLTVAAGLADFFATGWSPTASVIPAPKFPHTPSEPRVRG